MAVLCSHYLAAGAACAEATLSHTEVAIDLMGVQENTATLCSHFGRVALLLPEERTSIVVDAESGGLDAGEALLLSDQYSTSYGGAVGEAMDPSGTAIPLGDAASPISREQRQERAEDQPDKDTADQDTADCHEPQRASPCRPNDRLVAVLPPFALRIRGVSRPFPRRPKNLVMTKWSSCHCVIEASLFADPDSSSLEGAVRAAADPQTKAGPTASVSPPPEGPFHDQLVALRNRGEDWSRVTAGAATRVRCTTRPALSESGPIVSPPPEEPGCHESVSPPTDRVEASLTAGSSYRSAARASVGREQSQERDPGDQPNQATRATPSPRRSKNLVMTEWSSYRRRSRCVTEASLSWPPIDTANRHESVSPPPGHELPPPRFPALSGLANPPGDRTSTIVDAEPLSEVATPPVDAEGGGGQAASPARKLQGPKSAQ
ncbi:hypothetical protein GGR56DRAFT_671178 [Xylariaceae sp. FL0804]|nr:hypothetical protein GGR56DRAFT_671178 [Xylariaceae sp. FL0804]